MIRQACESNDAPEQQLMFVVRQAVPEERVGCTHREQHEGPTYCGKEFVAINIESASPIFERREWNQRRKGILEFRFLT